MTKVSTKSDQFQRTLVLFKANHGESPPNDVQALPAEALVFHLDPPDGIVPRMTTSPGKQRIIHALDDLPEDATVEQAIERLYFFAKVEKGVAQLDNGEGISHEEVKRRFGL